MTENPRQMGPGIDIGQKDSRDNGKSQSHASPGGLQKKQCADTAGDDFVLAQWRYIGIPRCNIPGIHNNIAHGGDYESDDHPIVPGRQAGSFLSFYIGHEKYQDHGKAHMGTSL